MVNFATIGSGKIVERFLDAGRQHPDFRLHTVYSRDSLKANELKEKWGGVDSTDSLQALAQNPEVDAVYIASPNYCHFDQSKQMLEAGKHVLCEKPFVYTKAQLEELIKLAKDNGVVVLEAMRSSYMPAMREIKKLIPSLGTIRGAFFSYCQYSSRYDAFKAGEDTNAFDPTLGNGTLMDIGVYCIHAMIMLFGTPDRITAQSLFLKDSIDASGGMIAQFKDFKALLQYSKVSDGFLPSEIQGEDGVLQYSTLGAPTKATLFKKDGTTQQLSYDTKENDMFYEIEEFIKIIKGDSSADTWLDYSLKTMEIIEEALGQIGTKY